MLTRLIKPWNDINDRFNQSNQSRFSNDRPLWLVLKQGYKGLWTGPRTLDIWTRLFRAECGVR